jgi:hypothetical protein
MMTTIPEVALNGGRLNATTDLRSTPGNPRCPRRQPGHRHGPLRRARSRRFASAARLRALGPQARVRAVHAARRSSSEHLAQRRGSPLLRHRRRHTRRGCPSRPTWPHPATGRRPAPTRARTADRALADLRPPGDPTSRGRSSKLRTPARRSRRVRSRRRPQTRRLGCGRVHRARRPNPAPEVTGRRRRWTASLLQLRAWTPGLRPARPRRSPTHHDRGRPIPTRPRWQRPHRAERPRTKPRRPGRLARDGPPTSDADPPAHGDESATPTANPYPGILPRRAPTPAPRAWSLWRSRPPAGSRVRAAPQPASMMRTTRGRTLRRRVERRDQGQALSRSRQLMQRERRARAVQATGRPWGRRRHTARRR